MLASRAPYAARCVSRGAPLPPRRAFRASAIARDHYMVLGVGYDASPAEIKTAFLKLAKETHPDANGKDPDAVLKFQRVTEAHDALGDSVARRRYDSELGRNPARATVARVRTRESPKAPSFPGGGSGVDSEAWNAWHYGEETNGGYSRDATHQTHKTRDSQKTATTAWFERRNETSTRTPEERADAAQWTAIRAAKDDVIGRLKKRREERRSGAAPAKAEPDACAIS